MEVSKVTGLLFWLTLYIAACRSRQEISRQTVDVNIRVRSRRYLLRLLAHWVSLWHTV